MLGRPAFDNGSVAVRNYRVSEFLGEEGSLEVYRAEDTNTGQQVLLKRLASYDPNNGDLSRFIREIRTCCIIDNPYVTKTIAVEIDASALTVVMEYPPGKKLRDMLGRQSTLEMRDALEIVSQCLCGLEAAHRLLICHRDLKPDNVYVMRVGQNIEVKIADFGIAGIRSGEPEESVTGYFRGSPGYMPPEQVFRWPDTDRSSDLFSLGAMLFEMLTGRLPYGDDWRNSPTNALEERIAPHPDKPVGLWKVVKRAIHPLPGQRYPSTKEMRVAIEGLTNPKGPIVPSPRVRLVALGAALGVLFGLALAWASANTAHRTSHSRNLPAHNAPSAVTENSRYSVAAATNVPIAVSQSVPVASSQEAEAVRQPEPSPISRPTRIAETVSRSAHPVVRDVPKPSPTPVAARPPPTITVEVSAQLAEVDDLKILLDGIAQHRATWGIALPTQLGIHQLEASAPGRKSWVTTVRVNAAKPHQTINIPVLQEQDSVESSTSPRRANLATADVP